MASFFLGDDGIFFLESLVSAGLLSVEGENTLLKIHSFGGFIVGLREALGLDVSRQDFLWRFVRDKVWDKRYFKEKDSMIFNKRESLVFDYLVRNGGVVDLRGLSEGGVLKLYDGMSRKTVSYLVERDLVSVFGSPPCRVMVVSVGLLKRCFS